MSERDAGRFVAAGRPLDVVIPPLRCAKAQRAAWVRAAKRAGLSLSEWIRRELDAAAER